MKAHFLGDAVVGAPDGARNMSAVTVAVSPAGALIRREIDTVTDANPELIAPADVDAGIDDVDIDTGSVI